MADKIAIHGRGVIEYEMRNHVLELEWSGRKFRRAKMFPDRVEQPFHGYLPAFIADSKMEGGGKGRHHGPASMMSFCLTIACVFQERYPDLPRRRIIEFAGILLDLTDADVKTGHSGIPAYVRLVDGAWEEAKSNGWLLPGCDDNTKWMISKAGMAKCRELANPVRHDETVAFARGGKFIHICGHGVAVFDTDNPDDASLEQDELLLSISPNTTPDVSRLLREGNSRLVEGIIECAKGEKQADFPVMGLRFGANAQTVKDAVMFVRKDLGLETRCVRVFETEPCFMTTPLARSMVLAGCVRSMGLGWGNRPDNAIPIDMIFEAIRNHVAARLKEADLDFVGSGPGGEARYRKIIMNYPPPCKNAWRGFRASTGPLGHPGQV